jgi:SNF2 family DNA or RNA helicase
MARIMGVKIANMQLDWYMDGTNLRLRLASGLVISPTMHEVVGAEYKGRLEIRGEQIVRRPSDALPSYTFTRYPPEICIEVIPPSENLQEPASVVLFLKIGNRRLPVSEKVLTSDQIIIGNEWFPIAAETTEDITDLLKTAGISTCGEIHLKQYLTLRQKANSKLVFFERPKIETPKMNQISLTDVPEGLKATLYPYQHAGFIWLCKIADEDLGCILGDEMGLGKTLQVIALLLRERQRGRSPSLVIAPATLLENWRRELTRFAPGLSYCIHRGQERTGFPSKLRTFDVVITSYETAVRDISTLLMVKWNTLVMDEAQAIKNPDAQRTTTLKTLSRRISVAVSGTPVQNSLRDLWSLFDFIMPDYLGKLHDFETRYTDKIDNAVSLEPLVTPLILRRLIADVAQDLPELINIPQPIELSDPCAEEYDRIRKEIAVQYGHAASLVALTKLRMFCAHPFVLEGDGDPSLCSTKYSRLLELLDEIFSSNEKVIIFTSFTKMADILLADLSNRYKVPCWVIDGRTAVPDRQQIVDRFTHTISSAALILNPHAAGTGLNITAANHVIHYNLEWNPAVEDQATARAFRRGQTKPVTVHRLFHIDTVEEIIDERMERKRSIAEHAVIGTEGEIDDIADIMRAIELSPIPNEGE